MRTSCYAHDSQPFGGNNTLSHLFYYKRPDHRTEPSRGPRSVQCVKSILLLIKYLSTLIIHHHTETVVRRRHLKEGGELRNSINHTRPIIIAFVPATGFRNCVCFSGHIHTETNLTEWSSDAVVVVDSRLVTSHQVYPG